MNEERAREILKDSIQPDGGLRNLGQHLSWLPNARDTDITLDGEFSLEELEAIIWWMKNWRPT